MRATLVTIAAFAVFYGWMRIVGNPHVVETEGDRANSNRDHLRGFELYKTP